MIFGGFSCLVVGTLYLTWIIRKPTKGDYSIGTNLKGYGGSIGLIVIGIMMLIEGFSLL